MVIESNKSNFLKYSLNRRIYEDEQLEIFLDGAKFYRMIFYNFIGLIGLEVVIYQIHFPNISYWNDKNLISYTIIVEITLLIFISLFYLSIFLLVFFGGVLRIYILKNKKVNIHRFKLFFDKPIHKPTKSVNIQLYGHKILFDLSNPTFNDNNKFKGLYEYRSKGKVSYFPLNEEVEVITGSKSVFIEIKLSDPKKIQPMIFPSNLFIYVKDISILQLNTETN